MVLPSINGRRERGTRREKRILILQGIPPGFQTSSRAPMRNPKNVGIKR